MEIRYFRTAWDDLRQSPGWFGKIVLLALLNLIPIFGQIVTLGYLYGWAREIAWNVHEPLPERIFGNEDGKLYRRGFFVLVVQVVYLIIPAVLYFVGAGLTGMWSDLGSDLQYGMDPYSYYYYYGAAPIAAYRYFGWGVLAIVASAVIGILMQLLMWAGSMRTSVYNRVSAGLQFGRVWKMMRKDVRGLLRIFGIQIVFGLIVSAFTLIVGTIAVVASVGSIIAIGVGGMAGATESALLAFMAPIVLLLFVVMAFGASIIQMIADAVIIRACGYWTSQFDVPSWRGQDEPMPFEEGAPTAAYYAPWAGYAASAQQSQWAQQQAPYRGQPQPFEAQASEQGQASYQGQAPYQGQQPYAQPSQEAPRRGEAPQAPQQPRTYRTDEPHADDWQSGERASAPGQQNGSQPSDSAAEAAESMANAAAAGTKVPEAHSVATANESGEDGVKSGGNDNAVGGGDVDGDAASGEAARQSERER